MRRRVGSIVHKNLISQVREAPAQRPLSDEEFKKVIDGLRKSVDTSARATESFRDFLERVVSTVVRGNKEVTDELRALQVLKKSHRLISISSLGSEEYRLRCPIPVELYQEEGEVVAHAPDLEEFATGATEYEALDALREAISETYAFLLSNRRDLGPALVAQLRRFEELVEEVK